MMEIKKVVIAADSFKGSLTSEEVARSVEEGIHHIFPGCKTEKAYIADGGEGTAEALTRTLGGEMVEVEVNDPLMRPVKAAYGLVDEGKTAVIEMASASGLPLVEPTLRNPMKTTTYGTGELIRNALLRGCRRFLIGIGGSATNDAGTGMLQALGYRFLDASGAELERGGEILSRIASIDNSGRLPELSDAQFIVACDVTNPFSGPTGAAYVFAPQKGADAVMVRQLDEGLKHFATVIRTNTGIDLEQCPGSGAAGGLGGGLVAFLHATLTSGIDMVLETIGFDELIREADLIITGEGKLDGQTAMGKAPRGVLNAASKQHIPVIAIGGAVESVDELNRQGFAAVFPILPEPASLARAMESKYARENIIRTVEQLMRTIHFINR